MTLVKRRAEDGSGFCECEACDKYGMCAEDARRGGTRIVSE